MTHVKAEASRLAPEPHVAALLGAVFETMRSELAAQDWGGLRPSHFRLLESIPAAGTTSTDLAPVLRMTKQAVGQFVTQLVESGHLRVDSDEADRRRRVVRRTRLGDSTVEEVSIQMYELEQRWAVVIGPERYRQFRSVLEELAAEHLEHLMRTASPGPVRTESGGRADQSP